MMLLLLSLTACFDETACSTMAVYSTTVTVVDEDGSTISGATATYTVDGGEPVSCEAIGTDLACGVEVAGTLEITASAEGYEDATTTVEVGADECHVIPEAVTLALVELDCTAEVVPAVLVHVVGSSGETLDGTQVAYRQGDTAADIACTTQDEVNWVCGEDIWGEFHITAVASGHESQTQDVTVAPDAAECHPETETVEFALDWLPD